MDDKYEVIWAESAELDLREIIDYIADDNPLNARSILKKIKRTASALDFSPERGRIVPELKKYGIFQYRELIIKPWRILYRISENKVLVLSVIDGRRNIEDILLNRMLRDNTITY